MKTLSCLLGVASNCLQSPEQSGMHVSLASAKKPKIIRRKGNPERPFCLFEEEKDPQVKRLTTILFPRGPQKGSPPFLAPGSSEPPPDPRESEMLGSMPFCFL